MNKLFKKSIGKPKESMAFTTFTTYRNNYNKLKNVMKHQYFAERLYQYKTDVRKTWSILNTAIGRSNKKIIISDSFKIDNNENLTNPRLISNAFCNYFTEVGRTFASKIPRSNKTFDEYMIPMNNASLFMYPTDSNEIYKTIMSLKPKTSHGHDNISSKLLKLLVNSLTIPLTSIINKSLSNGTVPKNWKLAKVIPIYKSKDKSLMNNYRPISLLPSMSKILEKIVHHRLYKFCDTKGILNKKTIWLPSQTFDYTRSYRFCWKYIKGY